MMPAIIAHRGLSSLAPENTHSAMVLAAKQQLQWVELDVAPAAGNQLIIFHDEDLERCTDGFGKLAEHTIEQLQALDAGNWFSPQFRGEQLLSLTAMLELLQHLQLGLNLEIKPHQADPQQMAATVIADLRQVGFAAENLVISSFNPEVLRACQLMAPEYPRAMLYKRLPRNWQDMAMQLALTNIHCHQRWLTRRQAHAIKATGLGLYCYTVNRQATAKRLWSWGVDGVFSDWPQLLSPPAIPVTPSKAG